MAGMDLVVKMLLKSDDFEKGIVNAKAKLNGFEKTANQVKSSISNVIGAFAKLTGGIGLAVGGVEAFKKTLRATEEGADNMDRAIYAAKSSVDKFFLSIRTGSFDSFIKGLSDIKENAKQAFDALDNLGTMKMWSKSRTDVLKAQIAEDRVIVMSKSTTQKEKDDAADRIKLNTAKIEALTGDVLSATRNAKKAVLRDISGVGEIVPDFMLQGIVDVFEKQGQYGIRQKMANVFEKFTKEVIESIPMQDASGMAYTQQVRKTVWLDESMKQYYYALNNFLANEDKIKQYYDLLSEEATLRSEVASTELQANRAIDRVNGGGSGGTTGGGSTSKRLYDAVALDIPNAMPIMQIEETIAKLPAEIDALTPVLEQLHEEWMKQLEDMNLYAQMIGSIGNAFGSLSSIMADDSPEKKMLSAMSSVANAAQSMITTYTSLAAAATASGAMKAGESLPWPYNMIAMVSYAATAFSTIASIKSTIGGYATGGIVPGNSYSGDNVLIRANSDEMVLNDAQQNHLWTMIKYGGGSGGGRVQFVIEGQTLKGVLDNYNKTSNL